MSPDFKTHGNEREIIALTSDMMHKHYCENDVEAIIAQLDDDVVWMGAGENEYAAGGEEVCAIFRSFAGQVPKCNISEEEYSVVQITPEAYLCTGRMWIATDASTKISLRAHQRVTMVFRLREGHFRCCHIHISNPYGDMAEDDVGFPVKMARQSYQYLQEQVEIQKRQIAEQTELLQRMSFEDSLTGVYNRNKFNQVMDERRSGHAGPLGVACFDLNGLKGVNDRQGHSAGDALIRCAAAQLRQVFDAAVYRTGGDEFVVVDETRQEREFLEAVRAARAGMEARGISCAAGVSWREAGAGAREQYDEADRLMYEEKRHFYTIKSHDRRKGDTNRSGTP